MKSFTSLLPIICWAVLHIWQFDHHNCHLTQLLLFLFHRVQSLPPVVKQRFYINVIKTTFKVSLFSVFLPFEGYGVPKSWNHALGDPQVLTRCAFFDQNWFWFYCFGICDNVLYPTFHLIFFLCAWNWRFFEQSHFRVTNRFSGTFVIISSLNCNYFGLQACNNVFYWTFVVW